MKEQDPILGIQRFFEKEGAKEKGDTDFEIGDLARKLHAEPVYFFIMFLVIKKNSF